MYLNKILEQGLYILDLLSLNATPLFFLLTDSVLDLLFTGKYNNILMQLGRVDINLQIIDLSPNNMQLKLTSPVYLNNIELMKYIAKATGGNYFSEDYLNFILGGKMKKSAQKACAQACCLLPTYSTDTFRRLLCNLLGNDVEKGLLPNDMESLSRMVEDISYNNAKNYFKFY